MQRLNTTGVAAPTMVERTVNRTNTTYETFVLAHAQAQLTYAIIAGLGGTLIAVAVIYDAPPLISVIAFLVGVPTAFGGAVAMLSAWRAHNRYYDLAIGVSETVEHYQPDIATVRPFVPSRNGGDDGQTVRVSRVSLPADVWSRIFASANDDGRLTRDGVQGALTGVANGRQWYHGDGWDDFRVELRRVEFLDGDNRLTGRAWNWLESDITPLLRGGAFAVRPPRTNEPRTNGANGGIE